MSPDLPLARSIAPPARVAVGAAPSRWLATTLASCVAIGLGGALGLLATAATTRSDAIGTARSGPWRLFTDVGSPAANPYQRARLARTGEIPLAAAEGLTIVARTDSTGQALDGRCSYRMSGPLPSARFWTLEAASTTGLPFANPAEREDFTSTDVLRDVAGHVAITLAPSVQPGNWLPLPGGGHFALVLRLYGGTFAGGGSLDPHEIRLPAIARLGCRP